MSFPEAVARNGRPLLILASRSPRRSDLLRAHGWTFAVRVPDVEEWEATDADPAALVAHNARIKARAVWAASPESVVLGADTTVALDGDVFHKPCDLTEARSFLRRLSGRTHQVHTGVAVFGPGRSLPFEWVERTEVTFHTLDDVTIERYLGLVDTLDKAGAYGVQEHGDLVVARYEGLFSNVMGLPVERLAVPFRQRGLHPTAP